MHSHLSPNPDEILFLISYITMSFLHVFKCKRWQACKKPHRERRTRRRIRRRRYKSYYDSSIDIRQQHHPNQSILSDLMRKNISHYNLFVCK
jgi:hypothetical protein